MPIYRDKRTGSWRFDFARRIRGGCVRRRELWRVNSRAIGL